ncbi:MAG: DUF2452 domain-containing protein [Pseudomonadales bacterium]
MTTSNPQGKGLVPVLEAWHGAQAIQLAPKPARQVLSDYFTSLLVLSAEFQFKPCLGTEYHLYWCEPKWQLSLIGPQEWGRKIPGDYLGQCKLRDDMTWQIEPASDISEKPELRDALQRFHEGFSDMLDSDAALEEKLPFFVAKLPYYRLLFSAGLANSLSKSMTLSSLNNISGRQWLNGLPDAQPLLLGRNTSA